MILPVFYAFSFAPDTRYIYPLFPIFCILSAYTVREVANKKVNHNLLAITIIGGLLLASSAYLDFKKTDFEHQREAFATAAQVVKIADGVNDYYPEDSYLMPAQIPTEWPALSSSIKYHTVIIPVNGSKSLVEYIELSKSKGLTHLVIDNEKRPNFLMDAFNNESKYPYLKKVFDSWDYNYKYHLKIYKIDYEKFQFLNKTR